MLSLHPRPKGTRGRCPISGLRRRGINFDELSEEDQDWTIAEHLVEGFHGEHQRAWGLTLLSGLQKLRPSRRYKTAWKVLDTWLIGCPTQQALPCPREVALACAVLLVFPGFVAEGTAVLLCFVALLRISEALQLRLADVFFSTEGIRRVVILILDRTKRGRDQRVVVAKFEVVQWIAVVYQRRINEGARKDHCLLPTSYK